MFKRYSCTFALLCLSCLLFAQPFTPNESGYITDPDFHYLIKQRGYQLVGSFTTTRGRPNDEVTFAFVLKNDSICYLDNYGREITMKEIFPPWPKTQAHAVAKHYQVIGRQGKHGLTDQFGDTALTAVYDKITVYTDSAVFAKKNGEVLAFMPDQYGDLSGVDYNSFKLPIRSDRSFTPLSFFPALFIQRQNGKLAVFNARGQQLTPLFDFVNWYHQIGLGTITVGKYPNIKQGLIDSTGKFLLDTVYTGIVPSRDFFIVSKKFANAEKKGIYNPSTKTMSPIIYSSIGDFSVPYATVSIGYGAGRKFGVIDTLGNEALSPEYGFIQGPYGRYIPIWKKKAGMYDLKKRRLVMPLLYDELTRLGVNLFLVKKGRKSGIVDTTGKFIVPIIYDDIRQAWDGNFIYTLNKRQGVVAKTGQVILQPVYDTIQSLNNESSIVWLNGKCGLLDKNYKQTVPYLYDKIIMIMPGINIVVANKKYGIIDNLGNLLAPIKYDNIRPFRQEEPFFESYNGIILAMLNGHPCCIDLYGNENKETRYANRSIF